MYFVNPKFANGVIYGKKHFYLKDATQKQLKELYQQGHTKLISEKADEHPQTKPKSRKRKQE